MIPKYNTIKIKTPDDILKEYFANPENLIRMRDFENFNFTTWEDTIEYRNISINIRYIIPCYFNKREIKVSYFPNKKYFEAELINIPENIYKISSKFTDEKYLLVEDTTTKFYDNLEMRDKYNLLINRMQTKIDFLLDNLISEIDQQIKNLEYNKKILNQYYNTINSGDTNV